MTEHGGMSVLVSDDEIRAMVADLGRRITKDYADKNPILVSLLKGGVVFLADLMRQIDVPLQIDFLTVSSYQGGTESSGVVRIVRDLTMNIEDRHVLVVEDVIDTGTTLAYILNMLRLRNPASVELCTLLRKPAALRHQVPIRYVGRDISNVFVVGYGLDLDESYRHLPFIAQLEIDDG